MGSNSKVFLSEVVIKPVDTFVIPVTIVSEGGVEMDGYITETELERVAQRAERAGKVRFATEEPKGGACG